MNITQVTNPELFQRLSYIDSIDRIDLVHRRGSSFYGRDLKELDGKLYRSNVYVFDDEYGKEDDVVSSFEEVVKKTVMVEKTVYEPV